MAELGNYDAMGDDPSPERVVAGRSELERVRKLVDALPERCGQIIRMRKVEGLSQREVAEKLGVTEHIVENDVAKGLKFILQAIAEGERNLDRRILAGEAVDHAKLR